MIEAGMNVARLNFAHGDLDEHAATIAEIRRAAQAARRRVAILAAMNEGNPTGAVRPMIGPRAAGR
jgi:pyruvate kinase